MFCGFKDLQLYVLEVQRPATLCIVGPKTCYFMYCRSKEPATLCIVGPKTYIFFIVGPKTRLATLCIVGPKICYFMFCGFKDL